MSLIVPGMNSCTSEKITFLPISLVSCSVLKGLFDLCMYMEFHGSYTENILNITYNETDHPAAACAAHGDAMHVLLQQTLVSGQPPVSFAMIYVNQHFQRTTFAYICPDRVVHPVRIRCHILNPDKETNYPNYSIFVWFPLTS